MNITDSRVAGLAEEDLPYTTGRYRLIEVIGEGGMGRVYRSELLGPSGFRKQCALKVVRLDATHADVAKDAFINEARLGGLLNHPNVVATLDFGQIEGLPFIAMELVDGVTLDRLIRRTGGGLPRAVVLDAAIQTCAGLDHAHDLHDNGRPAVLVHRDLKPSNIIVSRHGLAKVMDFGIAKANDRVGEHTRTGMTKGTPNYMSPEQIDGEALDRRSDIFAMGALLYIMLVGQHLFAKRSGGMLSILLAISRVEEMLEDGRRLAILDEMVPNLGNVVRRCLRFDPANRYASARELAADLKQVRATLPDQTTLAEFMEQLYGQDEPSQDATPLYRLSTDTRDARARDQGSPRPSWSVDDATSNPTVVPTPDASFSPPPARAEPSGDAVPTAITDEQPTRSRTAYKIVALALGVLLVLVGIGAAVGWGLDRMLSHAPGRDAAIAERVEDGGNGTVPGGDIVVEDAGGTSVAGDALADADEEDAGQGVPSDVEATQQPAVRDEVTDEATAPDTPVEASDTPAEDDASAATEAADAPSPPLALAPAALPDRASAGFSKTFQVRLTGADQAEVAVLLRGEGQDWRKHGMEPGGDGTWTVSLSLTPDLVGRCEYYFQAQRPGDSAGRVYLGSRDAPFSLEVR